MKKLFTIFILMFVLGISGLSAQIEFTQDETTYVVTGSNEAAIKKSKAAGELTLPSSVTNDGVTYTVTAIKDEAFKWSEITKLVLPATIDTIGMQAFGSCAKLTDITLPDGLSVIKPYAFSGCKVLETVVLPQGLKAVPNNLFFTCYALRSVTLPPHIKYIGSAAFYKTAIESIEIPESCDSIAKTAFLFCAQLKNITLPENLRYLGAAALQGCVKLSSFIIPQKIDSLCDELLMECSGLTSLHIPASMTKIGKSVFAKSGIQTFTIADNHPTLRLTDGVIYDKAQKMLMAFPTRGKTSYTIPDGVIGIWGGAFYGSDITSAKLPESMKAIDESTFAESQLSSINFPESLIFLGPTSLYRTQFTELELPKNNTILYEGVLAYCPNLTSVTIPAKVTYIDTHAFSQNKKLTQVTCLGTTPPALYDYYEEDENPFGWVSRDNVTLYVPQGCVAAYKATSWNMFSKIQEMATPVLTPQVFVPAAESKLKMITSIDVQFSEPVSIVSSAKAPVLRKGSATGDVVPVTSKWSVIISPDDKAKQTIRIVSFDYDGYTEYFNLDPSAEYFMVIPASIIKGSTSGMQNEEMVVHYLGENVTHVKEVGENMKIQRTGNRMMVELGELSGVDIEIYSITGIPVVQMKNKKGLFEIPQLPRGSYVLRLISEKQNYTVKFVHP